MGDTEAVNTIAEILHQHYCECLGTAHEADTRAARAVVKAMRQTTTTKRPRWRR